MGAHKRTTTTASPASINIHATCVACRKPSTPWSAVFPSAPGGSRTLIPVGAVAFEATAYTIPPPEQSAWRIGFYRQRQGRELLSTPFHRSSPSVISRLIKAGKLLSSTRPCRIIRAMPSIPRLATSVEPSAFPGVEPDGGDRPTKWNPSDSPKATS